MTGTRVPSSTVRDRVVSEARPELSRAYDELADDYDEHWSVLVREPQQRLTRSLGLRRGQRCADVGCGTGLDTLEMLKRIAPGELVAVDTSESMLLTAQRHARAAGLTLTLHKEDGASFIAHAQPESFDVLSLRFCLGYLDWHTALGQLPRIVRAGGRIGLLTILSTSAPQAFAAYQELVAELGLPAVERTGPSSLEAIEQRLREAGCSTHEGWTDSFRVWFATAAQLSEFLQKTGIATHPLLEKLPKAAAQLLWSRFQEKVERFRVSEGIPLDFDIAGLCATRI